MRHVFTSLLLAMLLLAFPSLVQADAYDAMDAAIHDHMDGFWFGHRGRAVDVTRTITVSAVGSRFVPQTINVKLGETVRFTIVNRDKVAHEFVIGDIAEQAEHDKEMAAMPGMPMDDANGVMIAPGTTASLVWTFTRPGELQYACHLPGHYLGGMAGWLTVHD